MKTIIFICLSFLPFQTNAQKWISFGFHYPDKTNFKSNIQLPNSNVKNIDFPGFFITLNKENRKDEYLKFGHRLTFGAINSAIRFKFEKDFVDNGWLQKGTLSGFSPYVSYSPTLSYLILDKKSIAIKPYLGVKGSYFFLYNYSYEILMITSSGLKRPVSGIFFPRNTRRPVFSLDGGIEFIFPNSVIQKLFMEYSFSNDRISEGRFVLDGKNSFLENQFYKRASYLSLGFSISSKRRIKSKHSPLLRN